MKEQDKKEIAQSFIRGLGNRDANLLLSIMTEDVVWSLPGESPMSGEAKGVDAILKRASTLHGFNIKIEIERVVYGLRDVALHLHNTGTHVGKILDEHLTTVIRLDETESVGSTHLSPMFLCSTNTSPSRSETQGLC